jgi:integrase
MRIRRRTNGWWYGLTPDGWESLKTRDRDEALRKAADHKARPKGDTVTDVMASYLEYKSDRPSAERMDFAWKRLKPHFGPYRPDQITRDTCKMYIAKRRKAGAGNGTIIKELTTLRAAIRHHDKNCGADFVFPPSPPPKDRFLTKDEYKRLLAACKYAHVKLFVALALTTAGRKEAILDLTWDRVDFATGNINLGRGTRQKGRAIVKMGPELRKLLTESQEGATTDYVIEWAGDRVKNIRKAFDKACALANLKDVTPHVLRHTAAVWMAEEGQSMSVIAQHLGHRDTHTTERVYARFSPSYLEKTTSILDSALSGD